MGENVTNLISVVIHPTGLAEGVLREGPPILRQERSSARLL